MKEIKKGPDWGKDVPNRGKDRAKALRQGWVYLQGPRRSKKVRKTSVDG